MPISDLARIVRGVPLLLAVALAGACAQPPAPPPPPPAPAGPATPAVPPEPVAPAAPVPPADETGSYVVMVSFDGMRHDFLDRVPTPAFDRVAAEGVRARGLVPSYPSKTFPNHYTLATGLYPGRHGLVDNNFYDPSVDALYSMYDREAVEDGRWYGGEPIWMTAERQGRTAASFFWVGSEAEGLRPTYWKVYDHDFPNAARVDTVLAWLDLPSTRRPRLIMLYFADVDGAAHRWGPDAPQVDAAVVAVDALLGRLLDGLDRRAIGDRVNVVLVSDHGMAPVPESNVVYVEDYVDLEGVTAVDGATQVQLYMGGDENRIWEIHDALAGRIPHAAVHFREELPERWHYGASPRVGEIVVTADLGWMVAPARGERAWRGGGMHGWDPAHRSMHGIFLAAGPGVDRAGVIPSFENIHVHPFVAALLGIEPAPGIDGRAEVLAPYVLRETAVR